MGEAAASMREKLFTMRMSADENARLEAVATHYGLNGAGVIRMLLKREHESILGADLEPEDFELLRTLPADGTAMTRPHLTKALKGELHAKSVAWIGPSVSRLLRHQLVSRDGNSFALTSKGRAVI